MTPPTKRSRLLVGTAAMTLLALMASFETAFAQPHAPSERSVPDVCYPLVADPFMGKMLFHTFNASKWFRGERVYSGTKTAWGQAIHNGSAGDPSGWIGGVVAGQSIMRNEGWAEWKGVFGKAVTSKATMYQQYSCHVLGGFYDWAGDWNLERARTDNPNWWATVAFHL